MASAKDMRDTVTKNREALKTAIEGAASKWDCARPAAEEAIGADLNNGRQAAAILGGNPPAAIELSFDNAQAAADALMKIGSEVDKRFSWAEDRDLSKSSGGTTLEAVISAAASQLGAAAETIKKAAT